MKKLFLSLLSAICTSLCFGQLYVNNFPGATAADAPSTLAAHLTNGSWTISTGSFTSYAGCSGQALSMSSASATTTTWTLPLTVASGYSMAVTSFSFCTAHSSTGYTTWTLYIGGTSVGTGSTASSSTNTGNINITGSALTAVSALTGSVSVQLIWSGGSHGSSGTGRLDDFTLNGSITATSCSGTPASGTASAATTDICTSGTSVITLGSAASGGGIFYQWQSSSDSSTWASISGATNTTYTTPTITSSTYYRCQTTCSNSSSTVSSNGAKVTVTSISSSPSGVSIATGSGTTFTVGATGAASYQWQRSTTGTGGTYANITSSTMDATGTYSSYTSSTLTLASVPFTWNNYAYRCIVTNTCGNITSSGALLTVTSSSCTGIPAAGAATAATADFCTSGSTTISLTGYTAATGISYQWQSSADSATWSVISSATNLSYTSPTITSSTFYRCVTTCSGYGSDSSNGAQVTITTIASSPSTTTISAGSGTTFTVNANGAASYQWQRSTTGTGGSYVNITSSTMDATGTYSGYTTTTSATSNTLTISNAPLSWNGYAYRCLVTNTCGNVTSGGAILNVQCNGTPATGTATATTPSLCGSGTTTITLTGYSTGYGMSYQWQSSTDSATWSNISSATNITYSTPTISTSTYYRCISSCSYSSLSDSSNGAKVTIKPAPPASTITGLTSLIISGTSLLSDTTSSGYTSAWTSGTTTVASVTSGGLVTALASGTSAISYTLTNSYGCTSVATATVTVLGYCTPGSSSSGDDVGFATSNALSNISTMTSTVAYLNDMASVGVVASPGSTVNFTITNPSSYNTTYYASVWIDWNQDGTFGDSTSEQIVSSVSVTHSGGTYSGSFTVPTTARGGITAMRVSLGEASGTVGTTPCGSGYGAVVDFYFKVPAIATTSGTLSFGNVNVGSSSILSYNLYGYDLYPSTGNITVKAPGSQYLVSSDNVTFSSSITKAYGSTTGGFLTSTPVYVKYTPTSLTSSGNVTDTGGGAANKYVALSGNGGGFFLTPTSINYGSISPSATSTSSISFSGQNLTGGPGNVSVTSTDSHFQVSLTSGSGYGSSVSVPYGAGGTLTTEPTTIYVLFTPGAIGTYSGNISFSGGGFTANDTMGGNGAVFCTSPTGAPTSLSFSSTNSAGSTLTFTPYSAAADSYLVVTSTPSALSGTPTDGTRYAAGTTVGTNGTSRGDFVSSPATITGLAGNTTYYVTIFPLNNVACYGGPLYYTTTPLSGNFTTCPAAPATSSTTSVTSSGFTVNWASSAGGGASTVSYQLEVATDTGFTAEITGSPFSTSATSQAISSGVNMNTTYYYRITAIGTCNSSPSTRGSVTTLCSNPTVSVSPTSSSICYGSPATITGSGAGTGGSYSWSPASGVTTTGAVSSAGPSATTIFTVTGTNVYGCSGTTTDTIFVNTATNGLSIAPATATLCSGGSQLVAISGTPTLLTENFNGSLSTDGWVTSLGTGIAAVTWSQQSSPAYVGTTSVSGTDTKMMVAQGNLGTSGTGTTTYLTSPKFSLAGLSSATINWNQYFVADGSYDIAHTIDISTNGGSSWTAMTTVSADATGSSLVAHTYSIPSSYLTSSSTNVKIRFTYQINGYTYGWVVDNVSITGVAAPVWSPISGLFTNSGATTAYSSGTQSASVYAAYYATATATTTTYSASMGSCSIAGNSVIQVKPVAYNITGGNGCTSTGITIGLSNSQTDVSYQIFNGATGGSILPGTGAALSFGSFSAAGMYTIVATGAGGCTTTMTGSSVITANPAVYNVSGGNGCSLGGISMGIDHSDTSATYQLYNGASIVGSAVTGTGSALALGSHTAPGVYSVVASNSASCSTNMNGNDTISASPSITLGADPSVCQPVSSVNISYSGASGSPVTYSITWDSTSGSAGFTNVTSATLTAGVITLSIPTGAAGSFGGSLTVANGMCTSAAYSFNVTVYAYPAAVISSDVAPCSGYASNIVFTGTTGASITYKIDGGSPVTTTLSTGTYSLSTGTISSVHTYELLTASNPVCATTLDTTVTVTPNPMQWIGGAAGHETDWNTGLNWSCGFVPGASDDVTIPSGTSFSPTVASAGTATTRNLAINSGAHLTVNAAGVVNVKGTLTNNSSITGEGTVTLNNTTAQTIKGTGSIYNLDINNASGATIDSGYCQTVMNTLSITSGNLATSDSLVLGSDSNGTARVAPIPATGAAITGNVRVLQYIEGGRRAYRFWAHPFSTYIPLSQLENYMDITGAGGSANGFTYTRSSAPSAFRYDPLTSNSALAYDPGWKPFVNTFGTDDSDRVHQFQGIRLYFRGPKGQGLDGTSYVPSPLTVGMTGAINQGNQVVTLQKGTGTNEDFNMVGNPYPSPVDIGTVIYNAAQLGRIAGAAFYVWNPYLGSAGQFQAIPIGTTGAEPYYLQSNSCFQVRAASNGDELNFSESNKSANVTASLLRTATGYTSISVYDANNHLWDMFNLQFSDLATDKEDTRYDAVKPTGADFNFYSLSADNKKLSIDSRPYSAGNNIPLGIISGVSNNFVFKVESIATPSGSTLYLHDKLLSQYVLLQAGTEYNFSVTAEKATQGDARFELNMGLPAIVSNTANKGLQVSLTPNPATNEAKIKFTGDSKELVIVRVFDMAGTTIYTNNAGTVQNGTITIPLAYLSAGQYLVEVTAGAQRVTQKLIKE